MGWTQVGFTAKGKTEKAIRKEFAEKQSDAEFEHGHDPYNGEINNLHGLKFLSHVFLNEEQIDNFMEGKQKGDGYAAQVKVITDSPTIQRWLKEAAATNMATFRLDQKSKEYKALAKKRDALYAKIKAARLRKQEASKRTEWVVFGWVGC